MRCAGLVVVVRGGRGAGGVGEQGHAQPWASYFHSAAMTYQYVTRQAANARAPAIDSAQAHEHTCRAQARANTATPIVTSVKSTARLRSVTRAVRSFHGSDITTWKVSCNALNL